MNTYFIPGWIGMFLIILAHFWYIIIRKTKSDLWVYSLLNILGTIGILINTIYIKLWAVVILSGLWIISNLLSLISIKIKPKKGKYKKKKHKK